MADDDVPDVDLTAVDIEGMPPTEEQIAKRLELLKLQELAKAPVPTMLPPKDQDRLPMEQAPAPPVQPPPIEEPPVDIGKLATAAVRPQEVQPEASPAKDVAVRQQGVTNAIPPEGMALLDTIATREAEPAFAKGQRAGWNTMVGGERFDPNTLEHPHKAYPGMRGFVGGAGRSYASGRYQETTNTYYENVARSQKLHPGVEVRGWSEEAQNIRNWDKAQEVYRRYVAKNPNSGLSGDLLKDLATYRNDPQTVGRMSRALSGEWTSAPGGREGAKVTGGKESYYGNTFIKMLANALPQAGTMREDISEFMNPQLTALQKGKVEGGGMESPKAVAQVTALMQGTPIEQIKNIATLVNKRGEEADPTITPGPRVATSRVSHTDMPRGVIPGAERTAGQQTFPVPGMETSDYSMISQATNPSLMSTIMNDQMMRAPQPGAPEIKAPSDEAKKAGLWDTIKFLTEHFTPAGMLYNQDATLAKATGQAAVKSIQDSLNQPVSGEDVWNTAKGGIAGIAQAPINLITSPTAAGLAAAGLMLDSPTLKRWAGNVAFSGKDWQDYTRKDLGLDPNNMPPGAAKAEWLGSNVGTGPLKTGINIAMSAGQEVLNPYIEKWSQSKPIGPILPSAHAATVFGAPPTVIQTPGGPVVMNDATLNQMVLGAVPAFGFGLAVGQAGRAIRYAREFPIISKFTDPTRPVPGGAGVTASSLPVDVLKASTVNPMQAIIDTVDRGKRYISQANVLGKRSGISPGAANEVYQTMRVQTRSGAENLAGQALQNGELKTDNFHFKVPVPLSKIHAYSEQNRAFPDYLRLRVIQDEIHANQGYNVGIPNAAGTKLIKPKVPRPETFDDHQGTHHNAQSVAADIAQVEAANPGFRQIYRDYQTNLEETRRFISDGTYAPENRVKLDDVAMQRPTLPIFSDTQKVDGMFNRVLNGTNPLREAEMNMRRAIMKAMSHDADARYVGFSRGEVPDSFQATTREWVRDYGQVARAEGAILRRKRDGEYRYWIGDPFVVSVLNNDSAPNSTLGKVFTSGKRGFESMTTGHWAPWFAPTAFSRAMMQGMVTAPPISSTGKLGRPIAPSFLAGSALGMAMNVGPRAMNKYLTPTVRFFEDAIKRTPLGQMIDPAYHNVVSRVLHQAYENSFYARMKVAGAFGPDSMNTLMTDSNSHITRAKTQTKNPHMRAVLDTLMYSNSVWAKFLRAGPVGVSHTLSDFNKTKQAFTESPAFGWAYKAHGPLVSKGAKRDGRLLSDAEVASMMRDYTGDPMIKGNPWTRGEGGNKQLLRFTGSETKKARANSYAATGVTMQGWRAVTPWAGVLVQSPAATLAALRDNPIRANAAFMVSAVMPEVLSYLWNMAHGQRALQYMMDERGEARYYGNTYFFNPDYPDHPEKGWEFAMPQEFILPRAMTRALAHQYMGRAANTVQDQLWSALQAFYFQGVQPPIPPPAAAVLGLSGIVTPEGYLNMRQRRGNPFDLPGQGENPLELAWRNMMPALSDISIAAYTAGWHTPDAKWGEFDPKTAVKGATNRAESRVAILGAKGRLPASSVKTDELFKYKRVIDDLNGRFAKWDKNEGAVERFKGRGVTKEGVALTDKYMGGTPPSEKDPNVVPMEAPIPPSNNPLYNMFMKEMMKTYTADSPDKGGIGFKALWKNHDIYRKKLSAMNSVHPGTEADFVRKMDTKMPKTKAYLEKNGVDPHDFRDVRDFYANKVVQAQTRILQVIQATEQKFNKNPKIRALLKDGQDFKLELLNPNKAGIGDD